MRRQFTSPLLWLAGCCLILAVVALPTASALARGPRATAAARIDLVSVSHHSGPLGGLSDCCSAAALPPQIAVRQVPVCYKHVGPPRVCCDPCAPDIRQTLFFCHPCTGCLVAVDVCLPGCCTSCPDVFQRATVIGGGLIRYTWCCGYSATIRFDRHGDITVIYRG